MSFQKYCDLISDDQKVKAEKTLLLTYTNSKGEAFSISPESIKLFLSFLLDNYDVVHSAWDKVPTRKDYIYQYEEKSYREIYKTASDEELKIISSTGRSQTKALTKLIAKLIGFLTESTYESPEVNTFFEEDRLRLALEKWSDLLGMDSSNKKNLSYLNIKEQFRLWMINKGLSERTASSYSGAGINYCDKYLNKVGVNVNSFYQLNSEQVLVALKELGQVGEWLQADKSGNSMYSAACKKLAEFLAEKYSISYTSLSKPFLLLAGISGTGKTRFVREQAKTSKQFAETYCLTSVRPDWHEPSDLLGYISRLNGAAEYITTDVLQFIAKAWRAIADNGLTVEVQESEDLGKRLVVSGERDVLEQVLPYWLCLDEMNLAPVEQYFADYLSVLETREWCWTGDSFTYSSDALLKPATIKEVADKEKLREALGFDGAQYDALWAHICQYGLGIPFNLLVAGTVNMDETTHGFSRKVIDRALSFDFGEFFPNDYHDFFTPTSCNKRLSYPIWSNASKADLANTFDADGAKTLAFLSAVNAVLKNTPFELAFRALNELLLAVASSQPQDDLTLKAVWDDFMMCKVLPRIEGDTDKLTTSDGKAFLVELSTVLADQLAPIWLASDTDEASQRPDLYREKIVADGATDEEKVLRIPCRSKAKLQWMSERLASATFTSFWP
ncbi:TPA: McrB family protein [Vibrio cholerae]